MPTYPTPGPVDVAINLQVGAIEIVASDRIDTVVTVSPTNPARLKDVTAAAETTIDVDGPRIIVTGPKPRLSWIGANESVDLVVELPTGSRVTAEIAVGGLRTVGRLGATRVKSSVGAVTLDRTGDLWLRASHGNASVEAAEGGVDITADHGQIRVGRVTGDAVLKASHGTVSVGESGGDLEARLSYGDLEVVRAVASVAARTAYGSIQLHEVSSGSVDVQSAFGEIGIAVKPGVPAWLDLSSKNGRVRNQLDRDRAPDESERAVAVRARTQSGDISVRRAP